MIEIKKFINDNGKWYKIYINNKVVKLGCGETRLFYYREVLEYLKAHQKEIEKRL